MVELIFYSRETGQLYKRTATTQREASERLRKYGYTFVSRLGNIWNSEKYFVKVKEKMKVVLDPGAYMPEYAHYTDAGADLRSPVDMVIGPHDSATIDTGVHVEIPSGMVGMLKSKSGLNVNHDITTEGVIDSGYTGSIRVKLYNNGPNQYFVKRGDKITQLVLLLFVSATFELADSLEETERGNGGFGSTGR